MADAASRIDGAGKQMWIAEMLSQSICATEDCPVIESNEMGGHSIALRTSIAGGYFRQYNQGIPYSKSTTAKATFGVASLEDYSQIDRMLAEDSGDVQGFREKEDVAFLEGMGQTMEQTLWNGNTAANPTQFQGFNTFYNTVNTSSAADAANVIDAGGTAGNNASLWLINWSPRTIYGIFPRGSKAGLTAEDKADTTPAFDAVGNRYEAYTMWFRHQFGLVIEDWRYGTRIANIDVTNAGLAGPNAPDLFAMMAKQMLLPPELGKLQSGITKTDAPTDPMMGKRPVYYCNRTVRGYMDIQAMRNRNVLISLNDYDGRVCDTFRNIPIKISDRLLTTEARVV